MQRGPSKDVRHVYVAFVVEKELSHIRVPRTSNLRMDGISNQIRVRPRKRTHFVEDCLPVFVRAVNTSPTVQERFHKLQINAFALIFRLAQTGKILNQVTVAGDHHFLLRLVQSIRRSVRGVRGR